MKKVHNYDITNKIYKNIAKKIEDLQYNTDNTVWNEIRSQIDFIITIQLEHGLSSHVEKRLYNETNN
jgi:hypothetical protein